MAASVHAFIDEHGNTNLDTSKRDVSEYFIVTAVLVLARDVEACRRGTDSVRAEFFQTGPIKSAHVGGSDERRMKVLAALEPLPFRFVAVVVDKRELNREGGLAYKRVFFKYVNRLLYERLHVAFENVSISADQFGSKEFMDGFEKYISKTLKVDLFQRREFAFVASRQEPLVQLADFIGGTLGRCYESARKSARASEFLALLTKKATDIREWPPRFGPVGELPDPGATPHDELIRRYALRRAFEFSDRRREDEDDAVRAQVAVVDRLLFQAQFVDEKAYISTYSLIEHLEGALGKTLGEQYFRSTVIAKLRDAGVIVASSPTGYKIPVSLMDIARFVKHAEAVVPPMLGRVHRARADLLTTSVGKLDILEGPDHNLIRSLVELNARAPEPADESD